MENYRPYKQATVILYILDALDCLALAALIGHFVRTQAVSIPVLMYCILATGTCFYLHVCTNMRVALDKEGVMTKAQSFGCSVPENCVRMRKGSFLACLVLAGESMAASQFHRGIPRKKSASSRIF